MAGLDKFGAVPLGGQAVAVTDIRLVPNFAVDVKDGSLPMGLGTRYLQVVNIGSGEAWLLPTTDSFLRALGAQCQRAGGIAQPDNEGEGL